MCTHVCLCKHVWIHVLLCMHVWCVNARAYIQVFVYVSGWVHTCMFTHIHLCMRSCVCLHVCVYPCAHSNIRTMCMLVWTAVSPFLTLLREPQWFSCFIFFFPSIKWKIPWPLPPCHGPAAHQWRNATSTSLLLLWGHSPPSRKCLPSHYAFLHIWPLLISQGSPHTFSIIWCHLYLFEHQIRHHNPNASPWCSLGNQKHLP